VLQLDLLAATSVSKENEEREVGAVRWPNQGLGSLASRSHNVPDEVTPIPGG